MNILRSRSASTLACLLTLTLALPVQAVAPAESPPSAPTVQKPEAPAATPTVQKPEAQAEPETKQQPDSPPVQVPTAQQRPTPTSVPAREPAAKPEQRPHATPLSQPQPEPEPRPRRDVRVNPRTPGYRTGAGLLTGGGLLGALGVGSLVLGSIEHVQWKRQQPESDATMDPRVEFLFVAGALGVAAGATLTSIGGVRYRRFLQASKQDGIDYPHSGAGRMTAGIILVGGGAQLFVTGIVGSILNLFATPHPADPEAEQTGLSYGGVMLVMAATGAVAIPIGAVLLHFGIKQHREQQKFWKSGWHTLVPSVAPTTGGATFGVAARF